jgi:iron-sulfur cluster insertion protein
MSLRVTHSALSKVWQLMRSEGDESLKLRAYITGGGCQGFQYGFAFEFDVESDDWMIRIPVPISDLGRVPQFCSALTMAYDPSASALSVVTVVVDPISLQYLRDAEIDYVADGYGERFVVHNPNAKTTCGCARSFTPEAA